MRIQGYGAMGFCGLLSAVAFAGCFGKGFDLNARDGASDTPRHLQAHTTFDLSAGKDLGEKVSVSVTALNAGNRRFLLDNSETFGGTHYADPRQVYLQVRYRFRP